MTKRPIIAISSLLFLLIACGSDRNSTSADTDIDIAVQATVEALQEDPTPSPPDQLVSPAEPTTLPTVPPTAEPTASPTTTQQQATVEISEATAHQIDDCFESWWSIRRDVHFEASLGWDLTLTDIEFDAATASCESAATALQLDIGNDFGGPASQLNVDISEIKLALSLFALAPEASTDALNIGSTSVLGFDADAFRQPLIADYYDLTFADGFEPTSQFPNALRDS